jgi:hypothetical protein
MAKNNRQSKEILVRLLVLYDHLEVLMNTPKPRPDNIQLAIDALHARIEREKQKLRRIKQQ